MSRIVSVRRAVTLDTKDPIAIEAVRFYAKYLRIANPAKSAELLRIAQGAEDLYGVVFHYDDCLGEDRPAKPCTDLQAWYDEFKIKHGPEICEQVMVLLTTADCVKANHERAAAFGEGDSRWSSRPTIYWARSRKALQEQREKLKR